MPRLALVLPLLFALHLAEPVPTEAREATPMASQVARAANVGHYDVGDGRLMHIACSGTGSPTVLFEIGWLGRGADWTGIQGPVSGTTRACSYDRAGLGQSDPPPSTAPRTIEDSVADLHALLAAAEEPGPYVLVGASLGGMIVRVFAGRYPDEVAGLVLVDASPPGFFAAANALIPDQELRAADHLENQGIADYDTERLDLYASGGLVDTVPLPPRVPTVVLTHGTFANDLPPGLPVERLDEIWRRMQEVQALVLDGEFLVAEGSGHNIALDAPQLVIDATLRVVEAAAPAP